MAQTWFNAKFGGKCGGCGQPYEPGFRILVDIQERDGKKQYKTVRCDACPDDKDAKRDARAETDAGLRSRLPKTYQEYLERCGTLRDAIESLSALGDQMRSQLAQHKRSLEDLLISAIDATVSSSALQTCDPASWASALRAACALGVIPDPGMGPAALSWWVPRGGKVSLDQSYRNFCNLAFNSPAFKSHDEHLVYECERVLGSIAFLRRSSKPHERKAAEDLIHYYRTDPHAFEGLSEWDKGVIQKALTRPDGLVWAWFRYQESPERLIHQRPDWFKAPEWTRTSPLPWGVYADATLRGGGHGISVITREECYKRAVKGGNVRFVTMRDGSIRLGTKYAKPAEGNRESVDNGWENAAWCSSQPEMLKKTAIRDLMTGGRVPISVRMQVALAAEVAEDAFIDGEVVAEAPTSLEAHLRALGKPPAQIEQQEYLEDDPEPDRETVLVLRSANPADVDAYLGALSEDQYATLSAEAGIDALSAGAPAEEWSRVEREQLLAYLAK